jgi:hypothetical protein
MSVVQHSFRGFALLLAFGASAHASVMSNTLDSISGDTAKSLTSRAAAGSFTADGTGSLGNLEIDLARTTLTPTGSIVITLNANAGGVPGSVLHPIATIAATNLPTAETLYDFTNLSITGLTSGSTYWIDVTKSGTATTAEAFTTLATPATGTGQIYWPGTSATLTTTFLTYCVSSDNACDASFPASANFTFNESTPAPEPASVAIVGAGLAGLGWVRRRRAGRARA